MCRMHYVGHHALSVVTALESVQRWALFGLRVSLNRWLQLYMYVILASIEQK